MKTREPNRQNRERGVSLILGGVLGMILAGGLAAGVGGWRLWKTNVQAQAASAVVAPPSYTSDDVQYYAPATAFESSYGGGAYGNDSYATPANRTDSADPEAPSAVTGYGVGPGQMAEPATVTVESEEDAPAQASEEP